MVPGIQAATSLDRLASGRTLHLHRISGVTVLILPG
ncbi:hypothetical protein E2C01_057065 [Portunus trituberculatus]|uniref:Uncharacterized protein n=1 Tax=Portunus trituberculatus TaxID=210409 RepID=A0A5B7GVT7_PORTR|nr:hypothetical protein [Portunus trituberculatus]